MRRRSRLLGTGTTLPCAATHQYHRRCRPARLRWGLSAYGRHVRRGGSGWEEANW